VVDLIVDISLLQQQSTHVWGYVINEGTLNSLAAGNT